MNERSRLAHAKVNLALAVDQPDAAGMHPIASWMVPITLADRVTLRQLGGESSRPLAVTWASDAPMPSPIDWPAERDLAVRALRAIAEHTGEPLHAEIRIEKRIPVGAGLGGGSAAAAAVLQLANDVFALGLPVDELQRLGRTLGSDVPFFLDDAEVPRAALVTGLGEGLERLTPVDSHLALIVPDFPCPTGAVYAAFDALEPVPFRDADVAAMAHAGVVDGEALFNDLAEAAQRVEFVLGSIRSRAEQIAGAPVHVTGSGSALFLVAENEGDARARGAAVGAELTGCAAIAVRTLHRA